MSTCACILVIFAFLRTPLECAICEIQFSEDQERDSLWDDRQTTIEWIPEIADSRSEETESHEDYIGADGIAKQVIVPSIEPSHVIVPGTARTLQLLLSAVAAYSEYLCAIREINFKETLMFQTREYSFTLKNPGTVDLNFSWRIEMDPEYPKRLLADSALRAAALNEQSKKKKNDSRPSSKSSGGVLYPEIGRRMNDRQYSGITNIIDLCEPIATLDIERHDDYSSATSSGLFSNSADRTYRSNGTWMENGGDQPFNIKPNIGIIPAGESIELTLRFSPRDVFEYKAELSCQMENLNPNTEPLMIPVIAKSLLPYCHFDIDDSDYLTSGRRELYRSLLNRGSSVPIDLIKDSSTTRVIEFTVYGINETHVEQFYLINPTTNSYQYTWKNLTPCDVDKIPYFHCPNEEGWVESGKRTRVIFNLFAQELGIYESLWRFSIDKYNLDTLFLLVATVKEPSVYCLNPRLNMKPTLQGMKVQDSIIIVNDHENLQLPFEILPYSVRSIENGSLQSLMIVPMSGILAPKSQQILQISFEPSRVGEFMFQVQCQVKKMKNPLKISVSTRVSKIMSRLLYCSPAHKGQRRMLVEAHQDRETVLNFGNLPLNTPASMDFEIMNIGDVTFHYTWDLRTENSNRTAVNQSGTFVLTVSRQTDHVLSESTSTCHLELTVLQKIKIRNHPICLKIHRGPVYRMLVEASAKQPAIEFSFIKYDFGPCYIRDKNGPAYVAQLLVTNNDNSPNTVEWNFNENLPHMSVNFDALAEAIPGHCTVIVPIHFTPLDQLHYKENLKFLIRGSTIQQMIVLKGEGIPYKISLCKLQDKFIDLGSVPIGKNVRKNIQVVNSGRAPVELCFDLMKNLPGYDEHRRLLTTCQNKPLSQTKKTSRDFSMAHETRTSNVSIQEQEQPPALSSMLTDVLSIEPHNMILLPANKTIEIVLNFKPTKRINSFVEKIGAQLDSMIFPLSLVRGSCVAREFHLNRTSVYFGTIVEGCSTETKIVLHNTGDFGAKFKWNVDAQFVSHFDLKPLSGYSSPGMDVTFTIIFHPMQLAPILEAKATIDIEKYTSLMLSCSGGCCKIPEPIDILKFVVPVRSNERKNLPITNNTSIPWTVHTSTIGEYFHAEETFLVPPNASYTFTVNYAPSVMNTESSPHPGRLIVKLPEDKPPLVYSLLGISLPPEILGKFVRKLPAKTKYTELLPVHNWLDKEQNFHCAIELISNVKVNPVLYSFNGNSRLKIPANETTDFRALFYCYKEAILTFRLTFTNDGGEYEFYEVEYNVTKPDILSTIKLTTPARSSTCYLLQIDNPLEDQDVVLSANCQHRDITIRDVPRVIPAKQSDKIAIDYSPLVPGKDVTLLDLKCPELGNFPYELKLEATPAPAEKITHVTAMIGSSTTFPITINNFSKETAEFTIEVDDPSFTCDKRISIAPRTEGVLQVTYEPCNVQNVRALLSATSESLGEILFPLLGSYILPKPQGPFSIRANSSHTIIFKNIFTETKTFEYKLHDKADASFSITPTSDTIKSKQTAAIIVKLSSETDSSDGSHRRKYPVTGKLIISCLDPTLSQLVWVYYLRGIDE